MVTRVRVPQLDANTVDVTVTAWRKRPGDRVATGDIVAELTTDKATFELESVGSGTLLEILAAPKSVVPSGYILALLGEPGERDAEAKACNERLLAAYRTAGGQPGGQTVGPSENSSSQPSGLPTFQPSTAAPPPRVRATPRARRLAQAQGIDLARVQADSGAEVIDEAVLQKYMGRL